MFTLAIIGRPNVGKSTLFNRLAGRQLAIVDDTPGVTRDWREAEAQLYGRPFRILDTAGLEDETDGDAIPARMRKQTEAALERADAILFLVDGRTGITPMDEHFARWLRRRKLPVILGVNKCENEKAARTAIAESYGLGMGDPVPLSSAHGHGLDDLYRALLPYLPEEAGGDETGGERTGANDLPEGLDALEGREDYEFADDAPEEEKALKLAIVGRPNVGKSTLLNAILGEHRSMTGPEAGITRDAVAAEWEFEGRKFRLVDTAGLRRKARVVDKIEKMAAEDTLRAIRLAQIVVLVIDGGVPMEKQDLQIAEHVIEEGRALVIAVNKWDAVEDRKKALNDLQYRLERSLSQVQDVPVVQISALAGKNVDRLMRLALKTYGVWNSRVSTAKLNRWLAAVESQHPAPLCGGRPNRLKYITQIKARPPSFALWVSRPDELPDTYKRYLVNGIREAFDIPGVPVRLTLRASKNPYS